MRSCHEVGLNRTAGNCCECNCNGSSSSRVDGIGGVETNADAVLALANVSMKFSMVNENEQ